MCSLFVAVSSCHHIIQSSHHKCGVHIRGKNADSYQPLTAALTLFCPDFAGFGYLRDLDFKAYER